jgi:arylsulfate sulfotransferase
MNFYTKAAILSLFIPFYGLTSCTSENLTHSSGLNLTSSGNEILVSPYNYLEPTKGIIQILDKTGKEIKSKATNGAALNFEKWNIDGQVRYTYIEYQPSPNQIISTTNIPGSAVIMDENLNELKRIRLLPNKERTAQAVNDVDAHDFILLSDNHYIAMSYYVKKVNNIPAELKPAEDANVTAAIIQEVQDGQVVFEWDSTEHTELYAQSMEGNKYSDPAVINDYAHMNSMFIDPNDGNLICSFRNLSQVLKIDRKSGNIIWHLGGDNSDFPLTEDQKFYFQHDATLVDDNDVPSGKTLLLFDNGSTSKRPFTRIDEFQLDEVDKKVNSFKALNAPGNIFSMFMGSVQKKGDSYFIGWGSIPRVTEINYKTNQITFDLNLPQNSYRALIY